MLAKTYTNKEIVRFLLGQMSEAEAEQLEQAHFEDAALASTVAETETDLIDDYVRNQLSKADRERFEKHYLSHPNRRHRVQYAKVILKKADQLVVARKQAQAKTKSNSFWQNQYDKIRSQRLASALRPAFAVLLLAIGCFWVWNRMNQLGQQQISNRQNGQQTPDPIRRNPATAQSPNPPSQEMAQLPSQSPAASGPTPSPGILAIPANKDRESRGSSVARLLLMASAVRDSEATKPQTLELQPTHKDAQLILKLPTAGYQSYAAEILTDAEPPEIVLSVESIQPTQKDGIETFTVTIPANKFNSGKSTYRFVLSGVTKSGQREVLSRASFVVEKK